MIGCKIVQGTTEVKEEHGFQKNNSLSPSHGILHLLEKPACEDAGEDAESVTIKNYRNFAAVGSFLNSRKCATQQTR
jgi:hypothetical protein